jgi:excisionase family DNA binding protein
VIASLLTYAEAAAHLTISPATVRRLVQSGKLRAVALSARCHRVDAASVRAYLRTSEIQPMVITCQSGKTATRGNGVSCAAATSLAEALERAKKRSSSKAAPGRNSPRA